MKLTNAAKTFRQADKSDAKMGVIGKSEKTEKFPPKAVKAKDAKLDNKGK